MEIEKIIKEEIAMLKKMLRKSEKKTQEIKKVMCSLDKLL